MLCQSVHEVGWYDTEIFVKLSATKLSQLRPQARIIHDYDYYYYLDVVLAHK
jgi:hypothetical protein